MMVLLRFCPLLLAGLSLFVVVACKEDNPTSSDSRPTITSISPALVYPGQANIRATILGTNFTGIGAVNMGPDIEILKTKLISNTEITVRFTVGPNAAPGPRSITVSTLAGTGELNGVFSVADNRPPQAVFSANPATGSKGTEVTFDASASQDPDGSIQLFQWDFGDGGKAEGIIVTHRYETAGDFTVTLTVTDERQSKSTTTRQIKIENTVPPVAHFNFEPQEGNTNTLFTFDGSSSTDSDGRIQSYEWEFGDGAIATGTNVTHKFSQKGDFSVRLTVTDNDGLEGLREKDLKIIGNPPIASFSITPSTGTTDTIFSFDASASSDIDGRIVEYRWLIENNTFTNRIPRYSFTREGTFEILLTVTDNDGETDTSTGTLLVNPPGDDDPPPPDDDDDPPPTEGKCTTPSRLREPFFFEVISEDRNAKIITGRFFEDVTCSDVFYLCGDVRKGGIRPGEKEYWMGTICEMYSLGNNTFRIHLREGRDWIDVGERGTYVWPQLDCNPNVVCR